MRKALLLLAVLGLTGSLWAADPIIGTWKFNLEASKFSPNYQQIPKEYTESYREVDTGRIEFTENRIDTDGTVSSGKWIIPRSGGIANREKPNPVPKEMVYVETFIEPGNWYVTIVRDGKQVDLIHKTFSEDERIMRQVINGMDKQGKPLNLIMVFDRQ